MMILKEHFAKVQAPVDLFVKPFEIGLEVVTLEVASLN